MGRHAGFVVRWPGEFSEMQCGRERYDRYLDTGGGEPGSRWVARLRRTGLLPAGGGGQWTLFQASQPVAAVLADPAISADLRQRFGNRSGFARLRQRRSGPARQRQLSKLRRSRATWVVKNVFAAPELSLEPRRWCFPVAGCLSYRGYFEAGAARGLAEELAGGDDVYVADISAYSTLGWFDDPLLNTFIGWPVGRLAELMFHELAHQRLYVADDTAFNEAFATAMGRLGAERWLERHGTPRERENMPPISVAANSSCD